MKKFNKIIATMLTVFVCASSLYIQPVFAATNIENEDSLYESGKYETVNIDGTNYTYHYYYEGNSRVISITNDMDNSVDKIIYNENEHSMYVNNKVYKMGEISHNVLQPYATNGWETTSNETHYVSWAKGTTVAVVAGIIAICLSGLGAAGVIAAIGPGALSVLASSAVGGTVYLKLQWLYSAFTVPQYRYLWSFKASTGETYGTFVSLVTF